MCLSRTSESCITCMQNLNAKSQKQKTALPFAYKNGHLEIVKLLLQNFSFKLELFCKIPQL